MTPNDAYVHCEKYIEPLGKYVIIAKPNFSYGPLVFVNMDKVQSKFNFVTADQHIDINL